MIRTTKRKVKYEVIERWHCDICDTPMEFTGITYLTYPSQYEHFCPNCGEKADLFDVYPRTNTIYGKEEPYNE